MEFKSSFSKQLYPDSLTHHGIKGQRWGVRRYQNPDGSLTNAGQRRLNKTNQQKILGNNKESLKNFNKQSMSFVKAHKREIVIGVTAVASSLAVYGGYKMYNKAGREPSGYRTHGLYEPLIDHIDDYSTEGATIKQGTKLQRVSAAAIEDLTNKGHLYCSYLFRDNQRYKSDFRKEFNMSGQLDFVHTIKPKHDLKIASPRTCAEIMANLYPKLRDDQFRMVCDPYAFGNDKGIEDDVDQAFNDATKKRRAALVSELKKRGYSGIVDLEDATKLKGSKPIIIFEPDSHVAVTKSRKIGVFETFVADRLK